MSNRGKYISNTFQPNTELYGRQVEVINEDGKVIRTGTLVAINNPWEWVVDDTVVVLSDSCDANVDEGQPIRLYPIG